MITHYHFLIPKETLKYTNEEITVVWKPKLCIHSAICFKGLPQVFDPKARPWVNINGTDAQRIVEQVYKCPSGALSIDNQKEPTPLNTKTGEADVRILVQPNGPFLLNGSFVLTFADGREEKKEGNPYCDGSHQKFRFEG